MTEPINKNWGMIGAISAGVAASACCTIPLALVTVGVGGSLVGAFTAMEPYRPYFIAVALAALGYVAFRELQRSRDPDCECEGEMSNKARRSLLVVGFLITAALIASPWIIRSTVANDATMAVTELSGLHQVVLEVEGMTCEACDIIVSRALTNLEGVEEALVTFEPPQAIVRFDPRRVSIADMEEATSDAGYPATLKNGAL